MYGYCDEKIDIGHSWDFLHVKGSVVLLNWSHLPILIMAIEVRSTDDHVSITILALEWRPSDPLFGSMSLFKERTLGWEIIRAWWCTQGWQFPLATISITLSYSHRKWSRTKRTSLLFNSLTIACPSNLKCQWLLLMAALCTWVARIVLYA